MYSNYARCKITLQITLKLLHRNEIHNSELSMKSIKKNTMTIFINQDFFTIEKCISFISYIRCIAMKLLM